MLFDNTHIFLVTGASSGIGQGIALKLNASGAKVIAVGRSEKGLAETKQAAMFPNQLLTEQKDLVENIEKLPDFVKSMKEKYGKLRGLICAAGMELPRSLQILNLDEGRAVFDINYFVPIFLAKGFADRRHNTKIGASILFIASDSGVRPDKGQAFYAATKAALIASSKSISKELSNQGIRCNCISPAYVETPMYYKTLETIGTNIEDYPLGIGKPADVASMATFLVSDDARWITGQNYIMDGGVF